MTRPLRTGEVAARAGVSIATLRYYERRGLIEPPERTASGYRAFPLATVETVRLIKGAQGLGFTLKEIHSLLLMRRDAAATCGELHAVARRKLDDLARRLEKLTRSRETLQGLLAQCPHEAHRRAGDCRLLEQLSQFEPEPEAELAADIDAGAESL